MATNHFNPADRRQYPARWSMYRGKHLFQEVDRRSENGTEELLTVSHITGITPRSQKNVNMFQSESLVGYKLCEVGDIAANTMWMWQGAIGVSQYRGVISPSYSVYRQRGDYYSPSFLDLLLREPRLVDVYHSLSTGIRSSRLRLYPDVFLTIGFPVPSREEQDQIVRFLDWKVSEVNKLIRTLREEINGLEELKTQTIDEAVVHGLRGGSESQREDGCWDISYPSTWRLERLRNIFTFRKGLSITKENLEMSGIPVINYGQIHSKKNDMVSLVGDIFKYVNASYLLTNPSALVEKGDFIFADTSEDLKGCGNCVYVDREQKIFAGYHSIIMHSKKNCDNKYFAYLFKSPTWRNRIRQKVNAVKVYSINQQILKDAFILVPSRGEQKEIVQYLDNACSRIDSLVDGKSKMIEALSEMKTTVISDVVTGKIDVRDIAIPEYEHVDDVVADDSGDNGCETTGEEE